MSASTHWMEKDEKYGHQTKDFYYYKLILKRADLYANCSVAELRQRQNHGECASEMDSFLERVVEFNATGDVMVWKAHV